MHPKKLRDDSIIEAICHLHFTPSEVSEIVIGRLTDVDIWKNFTQHRLPVSDIPAPIRVNDENLRYEPLVELRSADGSRLVRIGDKTISYHIVGNYCGWKSFELELERVLVALFGRLSKPTINRIGFRYVNALTTTRHFIENAHSLDLDVKVAGEPISTSINLNFPIQSSDEHVTMTKIASPDFVKGNVPDNTAVIVDIDVFTRQGYSTTSLEAVLGWIEQAHIFEKDAFFKLLPSTVIEKLKEEE